VERFPDAKYVFIARDPRNNIRSLLDSRGLPGDRSALRNEDTQHLSSSRTLLNGEAWQISADNYIELLSKRWVRAIQGLHTLRKAPSDCLLIKYEDFLSEKYDCIRRAAPRLDIPEREDISSKLDVAFQPRGSHRDADWIDFFGSRNLSIINAVCEEEMVTMGYDPSESSLD
jgi:hypothetical protein